MKRAATCCCQGKMRTHFLATVAWLLNKVVASAATARHTLQAGFEVYVCTRVCVCACIVGYTVRGYGTDLLQCGPHYYRFRFATSYTCPFVVIVVAVIASFDDNVIVVSAMPIAVTA